MKRSDISRCLRELSDAVGDHDLAVLIADDEVGTIVGLPPLGRQLRAVEYRACEANAQALETTRVTLSEGIDHGLSTHGHRAQSMKDDVWQAGSLGCVGIDVNWVVVQAGLGVAIGLVLINLELDLVVGRWGAGGGGFGAAFLISPSGAFFFFPRMKYAVLASTTRSPSTKP